MDTQAQKVRVLIVGMEEEMFPGLSAAQYIGNGAEALGYEVSISRTFRADQVSAADIVICRDGSPGDSPPEALVSLLKNRGNKKPVGVLTIGEREYEERERDADANIIVHKLPPYVVGAANFSRWLNEMQVALKAEQPAVGEKPLSRVVVLQSAGGGLPAKVLA